MEQYTNLQNEKISSWKSHKHPNNPSFMQVVKYMHVLRMDGTGTLYWSLANAAANDNHCIFNISLEDSLNRFNEPEVSPLEDEFQAWLLKSK